MKKWSREEFIERYRDKYPEYYNELDWSKFIYTGINNKSTVTHKICNHTWEVKPNDLLYSGTTCDKCYKRKMGDAKILDNSKFLSRFAKKYPDRAKEIEFLEDYVRSDVKVKVLHKPCGQLIDHSPERMMSGRWCKCSRTVNNLDHDTFILNFKLAYPKHVEELEFLTQYVKRHTHVKVKHIKCGYVWDVTPNNLIQGKFCPKCMSGGVSHKELNLGEYIKEIYKGEIVQHNRKIISPLELDIFLPEKSIAIEFNGIYWHRESALGKNYHLDKTTKCLEKNIRLVHIFENEWANETLQPILKSKIKNILGVIVNKVYARKCKIKEVNSKDKNTFLENNHLQGKDSSIFNIGLYFEDELVSIMTFCEPRMILNSKSKESCLELSRFCSKLDTNVLGGFSKLLKYSINYFKEIINDSFEIITYANMRYSEGNVYSTNGFELIDISRPTYWYFKCQSNKVAILYHRSNFMKYKLKNKFTNYDDSLTEYENMLNNGYDRIWDCGNLVYSLKV